MTDTIKWICGVLLMAIAFCSMPGCKKIVSIAKAPGKLEQCQAERTAEGDRVEILQRTISELQACQATFTRELRERSRDLAEALQVRTACEQQVMSIMHDDLASGIRTAVEKE